MSSGGAQNALADSRNMSVTTVVPNIVFGWGKYKHCSTLRDSKHGPDLLLKSMKNVWRNGEKKFAINLDLVRLLI